jgi:MFS family permease
LAYGKLYSLYSIKLVYLAAIGIFEIGSLICALSPNSTALIFGRAVAGIGAAGIFTGSIMVTTKIIPLDRRAGYLGFMSGVFGIAAIAGPFIGGAITERLTWRWCFGINLPLGVGTIVVCALLLRIPATSDIQARPISWKEKMRQFDVPGTVVLIACLSCLLLGLQWGGSTYPWNSVRVIALLVLACVLAIAFIFMQIWFSTSPQTSATIPASIVKTPSVWLAASYAMCMTGGLYIAILYIPIWFQAIQDKSSLGSAMILTPLIAGYVLCSIIAGILTSFAGYYNPAMLIGTVLTAVGTGLLTTITPDTKIAKWIGYQLLFGCGIGFGFGQPSYVVQTLLPDRDVPIGVTLITLIQNLAATIFVTVAQTIFENNLTTRLHPLIAASDVSDVDLSLIGSVGATQLIDQFPASERPMVLDAYSAALIYTLYIALALSCASVVGTAFTEWKSMKSSESDVNIDQVEQ